ncbi:uncharacterized protein RAG0_04160 [Rhynchosporium agropyri]|uniref:Uncharacterized protein n=1 Tax=Rhynchosporium agropyri TaxID=914238 RepID=A0A1E1K7R7_9HELO|nr:uncharacterized protein RAG0_04160 [Rhynchosporium agropyri]
MSPPSSIQATNIIIKDRVTPVEAPVFEATAPPTPGPTADMASHVASMQTNMSLDSDRIPRSASTPWIIRPLKFP